MTVQGEGTRASPGSRRSKAIGMDSPSRRSPLWNPGGVGGLPVGSVELGFPGRAATGRDLRGDVLRNLARGNTKGQG